MGPQRQACLECWLGWLVVVAVFGWNVYRAAALAITHDEALTYCCFVRLGPGTILSPKYYDANNHVLHTLLAWGSVRLFGLSEFALRLVSLLGGLLYLVMARRLCRLLCGPGALALLGLLLLALNPFVLDYLVAARGYGLGLGLSLLAWYQLCRYRLDSAGDGQPGADRARIKWAGVAMGLAVCANLVYLVPNAAIAFTFVALSLWEGRRSLRAQARLIARALVVPGLLTVSPLAVVMCRARAGDFYYGADWLSPCADSLLTPSFFPVPDREWFGVGWTNPGQVLAGLKVVLLVLAAVALAVLAATAYRGLRRGTLRTDRWASLFALLGGGAALTGGLLILNHYALGVKYPQGRTGLFLVPLATLSLLQLIQGGRQHFAAVRWAAVPVGAALALAAGHFLSQQHGEFLYEWHYDAGSRRVFDQLLRCTANRTGPVPIGHLWLFGPSLNFYLVMQRVDRFGPFVRQEIPDGQDYYILQTPRDARIRRNRLRILYEDPVSHAVLAVRPRG
jgi:hypothetical protein